VGIYEKALAKYGKSSQPVVFLLCGSSDKPKRTLTGEMETFFIQLGADRNPDLLNVKGRPVAKWSVRGVLRSLGKPSRSARSFKEVFGLEGRRRTKQLGGGSARR
jgi:hypothetical protein